MLNTIPLFILSYSFFYLFLIYSYFQSSCILSSPTLLVKYKDTGSMAPAPDLVNQNLQRKTLEMQILAFVNSALPFRTRMRNTALSDDIQLCLIESVLSNPAPCSCSQLPLTHRHSPSPHIFLLPHSPASFSPHHQVHYVIPSWCDFCRLCLQLQSREAGSMRADRVTNCQRSHPSFNALLKSYVVSMVQSQN